MEVANTVREIGTEVFCNCEELRKVTFEQTKSLLRVICTHAFTGCSSLKNVELPDGLKEIGTGAFSQSGLESFTAPASVRIIH